MNFETLKEMKYTQVAFWPGCRMPMPPVASDIVLHLPVLEYYASLCDHVTEFGLRGADSTVALLAGCHGEVHSYDIEVSPGVKLIEETTGLPARWEFHLGDTGSSLTEVAETDLLFLDTLHTYDHLKLELQHHGRKARKFLAFHDTETCGQKDVSGSRPDARGIVPAIEEFLARHEGQYETVYRTSACNGLWVLRRVY